MTNYVKLYTGEFETLFIYVIDYSLLVITRRYGMTTCVFKKDKAVIDISPCDLCGFRSTYNGCHVELDNEDSFGFVCNRKVLVGDEDFNNDSVFLNRRDQSLMMNSFIKFKIANYNHGTDRSKD